MKVLQEFKEFALKGNVVDLAVGVIVGAAFGKVVSSLVADVLMPPLGLLIGGVNFTHLSVVLQEARDGKAAVTLNYGAFLQSSFDFVLVALAIFGVVKAMNQLKRKPEATPAAPSAPSPEVVLLTEIRDALKRG